MEDSVVMGAAPNALAAYPELLGQLWLPMVLLAAWAYLCGCFNGAVIVSKYILRDDVRTHGSGNAGLTNFYRTFGGPLTLVVILCDVLKAVVAILTAVFAVHLLDAHASVIPLAKYWAGLFCLLGHMFPCMFHFKGGKGILSGGTIVLMLDWRIALVGWGGFLVLVLLTRWVSLGSCWAAASFPFATWFVYRDGLLLALGIFISGLILWKHRSNIARLFRGEESKLTFHKKNETGV